MTQGGRIQVLTFGLRGLDGAPWVFGLYVMQVERVVRRGSGRHAEESAKEPPRSVATSISGGSSGAEIVMGERRVPLVDLRRWLGLPGPRGGAAEWIVLARVAGGVVGLVVDDVSGIRTVELARIEGAPAAAAPEARLVPHRADATWLLGRVPAARDGASDPRPGAGEAAGAILLIDVEALLTEREWASLAGMGQEV